MFIKSGGGTGPAMPDNQSLKKDMVPIPARGEITGEMIESGTNLSTFSSWKRFLLFKEGTWHLLKV